MQWNNRKTNNNPEGKKIIAEDGTIIGTAITEQFAAYICQMHNDKQRYKPNKK